MYQRVCYIRRGVTQCFEGTVFRFYTQRTGNVKFTKPKEKKINVWSAQI